MMTRALSGLFVTVPTLLVGTAANADGEDSRDPSVQVTNETGGFGAGVGLQFPGQSAEESGVDAQAAVSSGTLTSDLAEIDYGDDLFNTFCAGTNWTQSCDLDPVAPAAAPVAALPEVTPGLAMSAFQRVPLPPSELVIQPPDQVTLVNFDTNFYTADESFTETVRLLGQRVELRIWPSRYDWRFGDGATEASSSPGAAYPELIITHDYQDTGMVEPRVDTTYSAEFRVNGGGWRDVQGTVTIEGQPVDLEVTEATPLLN